MKSLAVVRKADEYEQIVMAEVYVPLSLDSDQEFMTAAEIKKLAYAFLGKQLTLAVDTNHDNIVNGAIVVESFIAREGDPLFIAGSWVVAMWLPEDLFARVLAGELNGFSIEAIVQREGKVLEMDLPSEIYGETSEVNGHRHRFKVYVTDDGNFGGGITAMSVGTEDDHYHNIFRGTITEDAGRDAHHHTFEFIQMYQLAETVVL